MKVLVVSHAHPDLSAGGAERAAYSVFQHLKAAPEVEEAVFLARANPDDVGHSAPIGAFRGRPDELLACPPPLDPFTHTTLDYTRLEEVVAAIVERFRPDVAHVHHFAWWGVELFEILKRHGVRVVFTIHEFIPICHRQGQMLKTNGRLCTTSSPAECAGCFPDFTPGKFFLREKMFKSFMGYVDHFVSPSRFLAERFVAWGLPPARMHVVENPLAPSVLAEAAQVRERIAAREAARQAGRAGPPDGVERRARPRPATRARLGFFGQINPYKGIDTLLEALALLDAESRAGLHVGLHGANLDLQEPWFREKFAKLLEPIKDCVSLRGPYQNTRVLDLMADYDWILVPSVWWENSPVVIQEALAIGKPVLCSRIGGMAEKVADGETGLAFEPGSASDLARILGDIAAGDIVPPGAQGGFDSATALRDLLGLYAVQAAGRKRAA